MTVPNPHGLCQSPFPSPATLKCADCGLTIHILSPALFNAASTLASAIPTLESRKLFRQVPWVGR
jgi:hypothetical protein